jgi:stage II sporulation protein D
MTSPRFLAAAAVGLLCLLEPPPPSLVSVELRAAGPRKAVVLAGRVVEEGSGKVLAEGTDLAVEVPAGKGIRLVATNAPARVDGVAYPGTVRITRNPDGTLRLVNEAPLDDYVAGVLAGELFPDAPAEALRALAILARSFALLHPDDLTDDPGLHQAYKGIPAAAVLPLLRSAVSSTSGLRLADRAGGPLPNYWYHSTCGGHTTEASLVFGAPSTEAYGGVACSKCRTSKYWRWDAEVPEADVRRALRFGSPVAKLEIGSRSMDGRVLTFRATAAGGTVRYVPAAQVRQSIGVNRLRSTLVGSVVAAGSGEDMVYRFEGRGWGHGVGLCQVGACALAREGQSAERILAFYYPGTRVLGPGR